MITLLTVNDPEVRLAKTITRRADGGWDKVAYKDAFSFDVFSYPATSIHELSEMLFEIEGEDRSCVIRGELLPTANPANARRLLYDNEYSKATFTSAARSWVLCDFDKAEAPEGLTTEQERLDFLISTLPAMFHDASYHFQWSSSAGLEGWITPKCHIWFWLEEPINDADLKMLATHQQWPVDRALFNPVQVHYTARPTFTNCDDPIERRSGLVIRSRDAVKLPMKLIPIIRAKLNEVVREQRVSDINKPATEKLDDLLAQIGPDYNEPILKAIAHYIATTPIHDVDVMWLKDKVRDAVAIAPPGANSKREYTNEAYLNRSINGAIRKFGRLTSPNANYHAAKKTLRRMRTTR